MLEFVNPWLLWGALLGVVPVVIHFLQRRSWNEVDWGAMLFLQAAVKRRQRQSQVESLLLLSVRCLIPILAALALSQPIISGFDGGTTPRLPRHWIFVIDRSASMQTQQEGIAYFDAARDVILRTLDRARPVDRYSLLGLSSISDAEIVAQPTRDREEFANVVRRMEPTLEELRGSPVLFELPARIRQHSRGVRTEVVILSDFARSDWDGSPDAASGVHAQLGEIARIAEVSLVDVVEDPVDNAGVIAVRVVGINARPETPGVGEDGGEGESATITIRDATNEEIDSVTPGLLSVNQPAMVLVTLERHQTVPHGDTRLVADEQTRQVQVVVEGREIYGGNVTLPAGKSVELQVRWTPPRPGPHRIMVTMSPDALTVDDVRHCVVDVEDRLDVLLIDGAPQFKAARFVELALNPWREASRTASVAGPQLEVTAAGVEQLLTARFEHFDVIVLCDVPVLTESVVSRLARFVESGGGLIMGLGEEVDLEAWSRWAFAAEGLSELELVEAVGDPELLDEPFRIAMDQPDHPVLQRFVANPQAGLQTSRLHRYVQVKIPSESTASTVLTVDTGDPLLIEQQLGRGRCLIVTTSLDDRWGSWALWPSFVPLVHEMVSYVAAGGLVEQSLLIGAVYHPWLPDDSQTIWTAEGPDLRPVPMRTAFGSRGIQAEVGPLLQSGIYELSMDSEIDAAEFIAVNVAPDEGRMTPADREVLNRISDRVSVHTARSWQTSAQVSADTTDLESLLARRLLAVVLCLLLIEPVLARQFRIGVALLLAMSAAIVLQFVITLLR
jgi:hypothetical protein